MTPSPPDEALHFRGKTLTPESPRPLHIPEPANIPVLENQMDPVFNDTSTYERSEYEQQQQHYHQQHPQENGWSQVPANGQNGLNWEAGSSQQQQQHQQQGNPPMMNDMSVSSANFYSSHQADSEQGGHPNPYLAHSDLSHSHATPVAPVSQGFATASALDKANNPVQAARVDVAEDDSGAHAKGFNFQTLLDNLSHPSGAAANATSLAGGSSIPQATTDETLQGISARSYQDPSIQSNYPSCEEIPYHQHPSAPTTSTTSAYAAQPSNHAQQHFLPSMAVVTAPGTESSAGHQPLPSAASFQHTPPAGAEPQSSPESLAQEAKKGRSDKQPLRTGKGGDDDAPWAPDVQRKYDEFLHDERVYVTEGLWDRFPVGSRLFVGQYIPPRLQEHLTNLVCSYLGNLPTERVTKRDMFHIFHKYGKLAQISIKQAYGFIQFLEAGSCQAALQVEQGALVRGRKIRECLTCTCW